MPPINYVILVDEGQSLNAPFNADLIIVSFIALTVLILSVVVKLR